MSEMTGNVEQITRKHKIIISILSEENELRRSDFYNLHCLGLNQVSPSAFKLSFSAHTGVKLWHRSSVMYYFWLLPSNSTLTIVSLWFESFPATAWAVCSNTIFLSSGGSTCNKIAMINCRISWWDREWWYKLFCFNRQIITNWLVIPLMANSSNSLTTTVSFLMITF